MRKIAKNRNALSWCLLVILYLFSGCSKKDYNFPGDEINRVFFNTENYTVNSYNSYTFTVLHTPVGDLGDIKASFPVRSTQAASNDVKVKYMVDNSLIEAYNTANGTQYLKLPDGILSVGGTELTIPSGKLSSVDSVKISVPAEKNAQLIASGYIVPFKIVSVTGSGNTQVSVNQNTAYLIIKTTVTNTYNSPVLTDMVGTLIANRTGWTATLDPTVSSGLLANMFDARTNTNWILNPAKACRLTVDMLTPKTRITGLRIHTNSTTYALTSANFSTSNDGTTWTSQGTAGLSIVSAYQYVKFYSPVTARYIRVDITGWRSTQLVITEFDVYTN